MIANKIALGQIEAGIGAGTDSISDVPIVYPDSYREILLSSFRGRSMGQRIKPFLGIRPRHFKPQLPGVEEPRTGLSMGGSTEITAKEWKITRQDQDDLACGSHHKAAAAYEAGFFDDLVVPYKGLAKDDNIRADTSIEKLAKLKPVFDRSENGTMTAGNSTPLTDGAASVLLASEDWARERGLPVQAYLTYCKAAAVEFVKTEGLLMAPAYAVSEMLRDANLSLQDFDFSYEIHEAFGCTDLGNVESFGVTDFCRDRLGRDEPLGNTIGAN